MNIYTIGHSTHTKTDFINILKTYQIEIIVDVRSFPGSNYVPHFNREDMKGWLLANKIEYRHLPQLGGRRKPNKEVDINLVSGWENVSFRNYAAFSLTKDYKKAVEELIKLSESKMICIMCAELVPWRCHRLIISNSIVSKGVNVLHIISESKIIEHEVSLYGAIAVKFKGDLIYPKLKD